jgi:endoglucanase
MRLEITENEIIREDESAAELVAKITIGWNLGNTLDAIPGRETTWGNPYTTKEMITTIKKAGFNTIRIPVSWSKEAEKPDYAINEGWMNRVKEIVDYAVDNNLYIILNTHHDEEIFKFMDDDMEESKKAYKAIWEQVARAFREYNYNLIFEGLNEPRTKGSPREWQGGTDEEHKNLNDMHQLFVDTVRASGGNNEKRMLMISAYAASVEESALNGLTLPVDSKNTINKLIVSVHSYSPYNFALNEDKKLNKWSKTNPGDTSQITTWLDRVYTTFVSQDIPVIGGEFGALDKANENARAEWAEFYVRSAGDRGIRCVLWDDGGSFRLFNRRAGTFYFPKIHEALMRGAGVMHG